MPRLPSWGTPNRTQHYLRPRSKWGYVAPALAGGVLLPALLSGLHALGARRPVAPGLLVNGHAPIESRCEECHTLRRGVSNLRCQRCHDPSGAGRLANGAHVLFGSGDPARAAAAPDLDCAGCHVEHRGRSARLETIDPVQCARCHFRDFDGHPEFALFRTPTVEVPALRFSHEKHVQEAMKELGLGSPLATCSRCHQRLAGRRDFEPVRFDQHCASCHAKEGRLPAGVDPVSELDALPLQAIRALGVEGPWVQRADEYESGRGRVAKIVVRHRDEWVTFNLARLRRELDPEGWAAERGALLARLDQLERRSVLAEPLAGLARPELVVRAAALAMEMEGLDARLSAQAGALPPSSGLARVGEVAAAARAAAAPDDAQALERGVAALASLGHTPRPLPRAEHDARRKELLAVLEAVESADPALRARAQDLRRRLLALEPGEHGGDVLRRVRQRRAAELDRVRDELQLRDEGIEPPGPALLAPERESISRKIAEVRAALAALALAPEPAGAPSPEELERKRESVDVLAAPCAKCHLIEQARIERVVAARPVLVRANYVHEPHLLPVQGNCLHCHRSIPASKQSQDLNLAGVESCRECHRSRGVRQDCQTCHRYHPPPVP